MKYHRIFGETKQIQNRNMKIAIVSLSEVVKHPKNRLDAGYWVGKKNGEKAYNKKEGLLEEDDVNGKIMLPKSEADLYLGKRIEVINC